MDGFKKIVMSFRKFYVCLLILSAPMMVVCQDFKIKKYSPQKINSVIENGLISKEYKKYKANAFDVTKYLPKGYNRNGRVDYTQYIQRALTDHKVVLMPNFPILVNDRGLQLKDDQVVLFDDMSKLLLSPSEKTGYSILLAFDKKNIKLFYPRIVGDRYSHRGKDGQWGFGISLRGAENIEIYGAYIENCWGDGIYIGPAGDTPSNSVKISNSFLNNNRRNGISITSGRDIVVEYCLISNSNGQSPQSGIDIEPNSTTDEITKIKIKNVTTENNNHAGLLMVYEMFKGNSVKNTDVKVINHIDNNSKYALALHGYRNNNKSKNLYGTISVERSNYANDRIYLYRTFMSNLKLRITDDTTVKRFESLKK